MKASRNGQPPEAPNQYLYEKIYGELKEQILSGAYKKGDWFPPERVLKDRFATTHLTVRNALAKLVLEGYIERYSGKGTIVIYSPSAPAPMVKPAMRISHAHLLVGVVDEGNARLIACLEEGMRKLGVSLVLCCHHRDAALQLGMRDAAARAGALVILEPAGDGAVPQAPEAEYPGTILIATGADAFPGPQVLTDHAAGTREAARYFRDLGYGSVAFISSDFSPEGRLVHAGWEAAAEELGLSGDPGLLVRAAPGVGGGEEAAGLLLARNGACRAFFCASDETAAGVTRALAAAGLTPGQDCSVAGWGGTRLSDALGLTSVRPALEKSAERVILAMREGMAEGALPTVAYRIPPELTLRGSCCRAP
jgi:DNA-binding LacI/PurR family transcriptional regulator